MSNFTADHLDGVQVRQPAAGGDPQLPAGPEHAGRARDQVRGGREVRGDLGGCSQVRGQIPVLSQLGDHQNCYLDNLLFANNSSLNVRGKIHI